ncbi:ATP-dependent Clp protease adapter ClpS [Brachybacterium sp. JHP9]|uniref:ATP-dependent Clp protease adapter protein ClpS n=1 Tax=Brachybacterium equifaecis TaxID=2910770 RepID=A0ABT0R2C3_9MICO|nr:ATP-dependent Clp protease adapter ClpS [Brachybacterium equifaecis]MCL6423894.1 ATP-dependent Clp protease adapter ClpS [Brachybacterium equifaecis]
MDGTDPRAPRRGSAGTGVLEQERSSVFGSLGDGPWQAVVHNDPVNLMSYVVHVFRTYFGFSRARAGALMQQVHEQGRAIVSRGSREQIETDVQAMHSFGLQATLEPSGQD